MKNRTKPIQLMKEENSFLTIARATGLSSAWGFNLECFMLDEVC